MELLKFLLWLTAGAVIGWFASRVVEVEHRRTHRPKSDEVRSSDKS